MTNHAAAFLGGMGRRKVVELVKLEVLKSGLAMIKSSY